MHLYHIMVAESSTSRRLAVCRWRNNSSLRRQILQLIILSISCASIFANTEHTQQHNKQSRHRRTQVAPLNTYLLVKDEFDKHRSDIESFVFQTLGMFYLICCYTIILLLLWSDLLFYCNCLCNTLHLTDQLFSLLRCICNTNKRRR